MLHGNDNDPIYIATSDDDLGRFNWSQETCIINMYSDKHKPCHLDMPMWLYQGITIVDNIISEEKAEAEREAQRKLKQAWQSGI